jgi:hypothetical protein
MSLGQAADPRDLSLMCPQITLGGPSTGPVQDAAHTNEAEARGAHGPMWDDVNPHAMAHVPRREGQARSSAASLLPFGFNAGEPLEAGSSAETQLAFDSNGGRGSEPGTTGASQPAFTFDFNDGEPVNTAIHGQGQNVQMSPGLWAGTSPARCGILRPLDVVPQSPMVCTVRVCVRARVCVCMCVRACVRDIVPQSPVLCTVYVCARARVCVCVCV